MYKKVVVSKLFWLSLLVLLVLGCSTAIIDSAPSKRELKKETGDIANPVRDELLDRRIERW